MELIDLLRVMRRWLWLIVTVVVVTELALWLGMRSAEPVYAATVSLQVSTPQRENVAAFDEYRSISLRDEITIAINNFVELLQSNEARLRVINRLSLDDKDGNYTIAAVQVRDTDFINVTVRARTPSLAAEIANAHIDISIAYYGELRAKSTNAEKDFFAEQLQIAEKDLRAAEDALANFRTEHGIYSLESKLSTQQKLLEQLQLERDQRLLEGVSTISSTTGDIPPTTANSLVEVDKLIVQRTKELNQFTALTPQYNILIQNIEQARASYQHLLGKFSEAELKITAVKAANFIQVIKPAYAPTETESSWPKLAVFTFAGSLGLGVMLAFFLQYIFSFKTVNVPIGNHKASSHRKRPHRESQLTTTEQEPVAVKSQHDDTETRSI